MHDSNNRFTGTLARLARSGTARQTALVAGANGLSAVLRFVVVLILADALSMTEYGYLGVFVAVLDTASVVCESGLHATLVRFLAGNESGRKALLRQAFAIKLVLVGGCVGAALLGYGLFQSTQGIPGEYAWMYPAAVGAGVLLSFQMFGMALMQALQRFALYATLSISVSLIRLVLIVGALLLGVARFDILAALFLVAPAIGVLVGLVVAGWVWKASPSNAAPAPATPTVIAFMLPLAAVQWLVIIVERGDIWLVQTLHSAEQTATLVFAKQASLLFPIAATALWTVLLPKVAAMRGRTTLARYRRRVIRMAPFFFLFSLLAIGVVPPILNWLLSDRYHESMPVLGVLYFAYGISLIQNPLGLIFYAVDKVRHIPIMHALQVPVFFACCAFLVPAHGAMGAAIAYLAIRAFAMLYTLIMTARVIAVLPEEAAAAP